MTGFDALAWGAAAVVAVPLTVLAVECFAALGRRRPPSDVPLRDDRLRAVALIPAHDEEPVIADTLRTLTPQRGPRDRVLVVADNCTDRTAAVARGLGAEVLERSDADRRGKGYALAFGLEALRADPPDVVVMLDADCRVGAGALARLVASAAALGRPVQAAYRMDPPPGPGPDRRVAAFAFRVKNVVRPLGLKRLGLPCLLTGTGMAFPWAVIRDAKLGHGHIVEDMQLAVDLAIAGHPAAFLPDADVRGEFPDADRAAGSQRRRWEHGHLRVMRSEIPRLLAAGLRRGRMALLALALELSVPPVSALAMVAAAVLALLLIWGAVGGSWGPAFLLAATAAAAGLGLFSAWRTEGRDVLPAAVLARAPWYAVRKLPLYLSFFTRPQAAWVRTQRGPG